ncbi:hypothetical protein, partial [Piscirickettsia litoralis]|uniref:hypothetical protein n=1 Tax=Piscirickettsia litoralis TaxID=1891921 RepID=UPI001300E2BA
KNDFLYKIAKASNKQVSWPGGKTVDLLNSEGKPESIRVATRLSKAIKIVQKKSYASLTLLKMDFVQQVQAGLAEGGKSKGNAATKLFYKNLAQGSSKIDEAIQTYSGTHQ